LQRGVLPNIVHVEWPASVENPLSLLITWTPVILSVIYSLAWKYHLAGAAPNSTAGIIVNRSEGVFFEARILMSRSPFRDGNNRKYKTTDARGWCGGHEEKTDLDCAGGHYCRPWGAGRIFSEISEMGITERLCARRRRWRLVPTDAIAILFADFDETPAK